MSDHLLSILGLVVGVISLVGLVSLWIDPRVKSWLARNVDGLRFWQIVWSVPMILLLLLLLPSVLAQLEPPVKLPYAEAWPFGNYPERAFHSPALHLPASLATLILCLMLIDVWIPGCISSRIFGNVNILAWVGWEILDRRRPHARQFWLARFRVFYYNRGIGTDTEIYDGARRPFQVILLDAERLTSFDVGTAANLGKLPEDLVALENPTAPVLADLLSRHGINNARLQWGVPVRFGYNEILYSRNCGTLFEPQSPARPSMSDFRLSLIRDRRRSGQFRVNTRTNILLWDWYLPTMATLLAIYAKPEHTGQAALTSLADVFSFNKDTVVKVCGDIHADFEEFRNEIFPFSDVQKMQGKIEEVTTTAPDCDGVTIVLGCGSVALAPGFRKMDAFYPKEGLLTWVEFAALLRGHESNPLASAAISKLLLSEATQTKLLSSASNPPYGLPATGAALDVILGRLKLGRDYHLAAKVTSDVVSRNEQCRKRCANAQPSCGACENVPLVLRRLPQSDGARLSALWEDEWLKLAAIVRK